MARVTRIIPRGGGLAVLSTAQHQRLAATNIANIYDRADAKTQQEGREWYGRVHDATAKGVRRRGLSVEQGAGLVAAVSPNMDWERNNIDAFKELSSIKPHEWDAIHQAHAAGQTNNAVRGILAGKGIASAPLGGLVKAHRIMQGEDVDDVLRRRTAPKTNSFAHNIARPDVAGPVTIDGRAHDIAANVRMPWKTGRGIGSADLARGTSRYEHFEGAYRAAAGAVGELPHDMQAITWVQGKKMEREGLTASGRPRKVGVPRVGQPYV